MRMAVESSIARECTLSFFCRGWFRRKFPKLVYGPYFIREFYSKRWTYMVSWRLCLDLNLLSLPFPDMFGGRKLRKNKCIFTLPFLSDYSTWFTFFCHAHKIPIIVIKTIQCHKLSTMPHPSTYQAPKYLHKPQ